MVQEEPLQAGERLHGERLRQAYDRHLVAKAKRAEHFKELERNYPRTRAPTDAVLPASGRYTTSLQAPATRLWQSAETYGSFFGPSQRVVSDQAMEQARDKKKRKASGSPPPKKRAKGEVVPLKSATKVEHPKAKLKFSRTDYTALRLDEGPMVTYVPTKEDRGNKLVATHAKQIAFKSEDKKVETNGGANVNGLKTPIQQSSKKMLSMQGRTTKDLPGKGKSTTPAKPKECSSSAIQTNVPTTRKVSSSSTHDLKETEKNRSLSPHGEVSSFGSTKNIEDSKETKKLLSTFKGQTYAKQSDHPRKKLTIENKIDELDNDPKEIANCANKKNRPKPKKRKLVMSDADDDLERFGDNRVSTHATMGASSTTPATTRKMSSSNTQDLKDNLGNKSLSLLKKASSCDTKSIEDSKDTKKLLSTFKGQTYSKQSDHPRRESMHDNKTDELEDDFKGTSSRATTKSNSNPKKQKFVVSDSDDGLEEFDKRPTSIPAPIRKKAIPTTVTTPSSRKKMSSSSIQDLKTSPKNKSLSQPQKVNSLATKNVKDSKDTNKLLSTFKSKTCSKQSDYPRRKPINNNNIDELEDDLSIVSYANKKKLSKPRKRPFVASDDDDDMEGFEGIRASVHAAMGFDSKKYIGRDDQDDRDMEADFKTIEREERRSERIAKEEDDRELALTKREQKKERAKKKRKRISNSK